MSDGTLKEEEEGDKGKTISGYNDRLHKRRVLFLCLASHLLNFLHASCYAPMGIIFLALCYKFPTADPKILAWVGAIKVSSSSVTGLLVGTLIQKFGVSRVATSAVFLIFLANLLTAFATNVFMVIFSYGFLAGMGYSVFLVTVAVTIQKHVVLGRRVGLANGFIMSGQGVGIFVWPPVMELLLEHYGWRGAIMLEGALLLNAVVVVYVIHIMDKKLNQMKARTDFQRQCKDSPNTKETDMERSTEDGLASQRNDIKNIDQTKQEEKKDISNENNYLDKEHNCYETRDNCNSKGETKQEECQDLIEIRQPNDGLKKDQSDDIVSKESHCGNNTCVRILRSVYLILKYPRFLLYCMALVPIHIGHVSVYFILPTRALEANASSLQAAWTISIIGIINTVGRTFFGWISDTKWLSQNKSVLVGAIVTTIGGTSLICAFFTMYWVVVCYAVMFGVASACYVGLVNVMLVSLVTLDILPIASGFMFMCLGLAWLLGTVLSGFLLSVSGSSWAVFVMIGACMTVGGGGILAIPCVPVKPKTQDHEKC